MAHFEQISSILHPDVALRLHGRPADSSHSTHRALTTQLKRRTPTLILYYVIYGQPLIVLGPDFYLSDFPELASKIADGCINKWHLNNLKVTNFENNMLPNLEDTWIG